MKVKFTVLGGASRERAPPIQKRRPLCKDLYPREDGKLRKPR